MAAPASEDLRELERLLTVARETNDTLTEAVLMDELGCGHNDLTAMLDTLREHGKAVQESPGEWVAGDGEPAQAESERVKVHLVENEPEGDDAAAIERAPVDALEPITPQWTGLVPPFITPADVRLTRAMVAALDPAALGALIQAGLEGVEDGAVFRIEVMP